MMHSILTTQWHVRLIARPFGRSGVLGNERSVDVSVPVPAAIGGRTLLHYITATLAWLTPVQPGRKAYRAVRMKILDPENIENLGVAAHGNQPDGNQTNRSTVYTRCWSGDRAAAVAANMLLPFKIQREPDAGVTVDEKVSFGLAVTVAMPGQIALYEEVRARIRPVAVMP